jgi:predicted house-cleaning noncanonical NTP pyrophosphatase (MazG superfamily)
MAVVNNEEDYKEKIKTKLKEMFAETYNDKEWRYEGKVEEADCYSLLCKGLSDDKKMVKLLGCNVCMFKCEYQECESILILFSLCPNSNLPEFSVKNVSDKVMDIVKNLERTFVTIDYLTSKEVKEDKFVYVLAVKKL